MKTTDFARLLSSFLLDELSMERITGFLNWLEAGCGNGRSTHNQRLTLPDTSTRKGRRDQMLLTLLYDSGARVQELADLCVGSIRLDAPAQVKLFGKGRKSRSVLLMDKTASLLKQYLSEHGLDSPAHYEHPLFFNSQGKKLTRQDIAYILKNKRQDEESGAG